MPPLKSQVIWYKRCQLALALATLAMVGAFYLAGFGPITARLGLLDEQITRDRRQLEINQAEILQLPVIEADINRLRADEADVKKLATNPEMGDFMSQIKQASEDTNVRKFEVSFPTVVTRSEQPVVMKFQGDFYSVFAFLSQAEQMKHLTRITNISIHGSDVTTGLVEVNVAMNLYFSEG